MKVKCYYWRILMINGKIVKLTTIEESDLEQLREWRNLSEYRKHFREYREISKSMQYDWFKNSVNNDKNTIMFAIRDKKTNQLYGCCGLVYINWIHRNADLSLYIGKDETYIDNKGMAKEVCELIFDYGFNKIGLKKIWTEIYEFDVKKYELYTSLNMKKDATLRSQYFYNRWWDSYIMSIISEEFEKKN